jgi:hypothetical protein
MAPGCATAARRTDDAPPAGRFRAWDVGQIRAPGYNAAARAMIAAGSPCTGEPSSHSQETEPMPLFLDTHNKVPGLTGEAVAQAHAADLAVGAKRGVNYVRYWYDEATGKVFCLVEAPSAEAAEAVHREAHGLLADSIVEVKEGA